MRLLYQGVFILECPWDCFFLAICIERFGGVVIAYITLLVVASTSSFSFFVSHTHSDFRLVSTISTGSLRSALMFSQAFNGGI